MLETPDTIDQLLTAINEYTDRVYLQYDFFNSLVGVAVVILCCYIFVYIVYKS